MRVLTAILLGLLVALSTPAHAAIEPLPVGPDVDYQLGGVGPAPANVGIVVRDREARPLDGAYNVCYVNAFQTQPHERRLWRAHPRLVLRHHGSPVVDQAWGERLLDTRTRVKRVRIGRIVGRWIEADGRVAGFDFAIAEECGRCTAGPTSTGPASGGAVGWRSSCATVSWAATAYAGGAERLLR